MVVSIRQRVSRSSSPRSGGRLGPGAILLAGALAVAATAVYGATYKWTDANGRVVYSDQPPPASVNSEKLAAPPPPANPNAAKELATKQLEIQQRNKQRAEDESKAAKLRADADKKREQCERTKSQLALFQSQPYIYRANAKGEQVIMDEAARKKERDQLTSWMKENCGG